MISSWLTGLNPKQKEDLKATFGSSVLVRHRLSALLNKKIDTARDATRSKEAYTSPNWALVQADQIGYERALKEVISLISSESVEKQR